MASVFTFNENHCDMRREQRQAFAPVLRDAEVGWAPFTITVTETTSLKADECDSQPDEKPGTRAVAATFRWNETKGGYEPDSTALADLLAETEARF